MATFRHRFGFTTDVNDTTNFHGNDTNFRSDQSRLDDLVRDLCIDDSIAGCFADTGHDAMCGSHDDLNSTTNAWLLDLKVTPSNF